MGDLGLGIGCLFVTQFKQTCAEMCRVFSICLQGPIYDGYCNMQVTGVFMSMWNFTCLSCVEESMLVWIELERDRCWPTSLHSCTICIRLSLSLSLLQYLELQF